MTGQALERQIGALPTVVPDHTFRALMRQAEVWAKSKLVPKTLQGNPNDVLLVGMYGYELGVPFTKALSQVHVIEGSPKASAQLRVALSERAGHAVWTVESSSERATVCGLRRGDPDERKQSVTWTINDALRAGLLDVWVEKYFQADGDKYAARHKYVVGHLDDDGRPALDDELVESAPPWAAPLIEKRVWKFKDNWAHYPADMLWSRAAGSLCNKAFGDAVMGLQALPDEWEEDVAVEAEVLDERHRAPSPDPDDVTDAVVIEDETPNKGRGADGASAEGDAGPDSQGAVPGDGANSQEVGGSTPEPSPARERGDRPAGSNDPGRPAGSTPSSSAGGGDSEGQAPTPPPAAPSEATAGSPYAEAIHALARELALSDEVLDACLHDSTGSASANAVTRENWPNVVELMRSKAGKA